MFELYEKVVYPGHGVALINRIIVKKMGTSTSSFYELKFLNQEMTILVPTSNAQASGIRAITSADMVQTIFDMLARPGRKIDSTELAATNWSRRHKEYQLKLMSGKLEDISAIYRELKQIELQKELSYGEKTLLNRTESLLAEEIAVARQTPESKALEHIRSLFGMFSAPVKQTQL
jgi:CarD family transcriptional regulator